jgi:hypothetical protein
VWLICEEAVPEGRFDAHAQLCFAAYESGAAAAAACDARLAETVGALPPHLASAWPGPKLLMPMVFPALHAVQLLRKAARVDASDEMAAETFAFVVFQLKKIERAGHVRAHLIPAAELLAQKLGRARGAGADFDLLKKISSGAFSTVLERLWFSPV